MRATVTVTSNGRVTIPQAIRNKMDLDEGDTVEIEVTQADG